MATPPSGTTFPVPALGPSEEPQREDLEMLPCSQEQRAHFVKTAVTPAFDR